MPGWTPPSAAGTVAAAGDPWASPVADGAPAVAPDAVPTGDPAAGPTATPQWVAGPTPSRRERREQRRSDPLFGVIGGLVLVGLGVYFLVRDQVTIDWGIVWRGGPDGPRRRGHRRGVPSARAA